LSSRPPPIAANARDNTLGLAMTRTFPVVEVGEDWEEAVDESVDDPVQQ
jgi:hypothetical protein